MTYWLCITNEENWNVVETKNVWGVAERHRNTIAKVNKGDTLLMYLKQEKIEDELVESRIAGVFEAASEVFEEGIKIFKVPKGMATGMFPLRITRKPVKIFEKAINYIIK